MLLPIIILLDLIPLAVPQKPPPTLYPTRFPINIELEALAA